jgi:CHAT domain-containing protein
MLLAFLMTASAGDKDEKLTPERRGELEKKSRELNDRGLLHYQRGDANKATELFRQALAIRRRLYPRKDFPDGHPDLAGSISDLAYACLAAGRFDEAEPRFLEALQMCRTLYPKRKYFIGHPDLARSLNSLGFFYMDSGEYAKAAPLFHEALEMYRALYSGKEYPNGHADLALSINNLAFLYQALQEYGKAELLYGEALTMSRALYPKQKYPNGHPELANRLNNLGTLHADTGEYGKAKPFSHEALDMWRAMCPKKDFPHGHPYLARAIVNLAELHALDGEEAKAGPLYHEGLDMFRALYPKKDFPNGHPDLASSILRLAVRYMHRGEPVQAGTLCREALEMYRMLYRKKDFPHGHPYLARAIQCLAAVHGLSGMYEEAEPLYLEALEMRRALFPKQDYPKGHPDIANSITGLGCLHWAAGEYGKAESRLRDALRMYRRLLLSYAELAAESESLSYQATQPQNLDYLLAVSGQLPDTTSVYDTLWDSRAALTHLQERRHRDLMASRDKDTAHLTDELRLTRMTLARFLLNPGRDPERRREKVGKLTEAKEDIEKRIAAKLKLARLKPATTSPTSKQLRAALPDATAFVHLYRYVHAQGDHRIKGSKGWKETARYVVFILRNNKPAIRVELKDAEPIDNAWAAWQKAITSDRLDEKAERDAARKFAKLVWEPIRKQLPDKVKTVYLAPDGKLAQVPWGALPGKKADTVLLDEQAICLVPHGPWLLERLEEKAEKQTGSTLVAYGGVDYDRDPAAVLKLRDDVRGPLLSEKRPIKWSDLPGTAREQAAILALAKKALKDAPIARSGRDANTKQLEEDLPKARYAHIATHGFFADPEFRSALQVDPKLFEYRGFGERRGGARSPLVLSGLVLAGANRQGDEAAPDHGIITAEGLIGLRMEGLELAVLSACETGLGDSGGGEGVYGLQRAFHVAGCKNVIASLWKVDDAATQALMTLFYRNLWEKKLDPAEALRQAQLTLYRNPAAVEVVKKRGADFTEHDLPEVKPDAKRKHAPTAHWAAFTFSGVRPAK